MEKVQLHIGDIIKGIVKSVNNNYAHISFGEINAILPSTEFSWNKDSNLRRMLEEGDEVSAVVIILTEQNIVVSVKRMTKNPWVEIDTKFSIGQKITGKVVRVTSFGVFIEIENGLQGLLHKSEISEENVDPSSIFEYGQEVEVKILSIESDKKRIGFSIKSLN